MRFFKLNKRLNLKYIFGEILLLFVGINLAIWFNNWNTSNKTNEEKKVAISKITEEIDNNRLEIDAVLNNNHQIINAHREFNNLYDGNTSSINASPKQLKLLNSKYPDYFRVKDSTAIDIGIYHYRGATHINLEIPTLTEIAWKTTTTVSVSNEFNYECLYELESLYNLQRRVQIEINKSADALQQGKLEELMSVLKFLNQLGSQLQSDYESMKNYISNCN